MRLLAILGGAVALVVAGVWFLTGQSYTVNVALPSATNIIHGGIVTVNGFKAGTVIEVDAVYDNSAANPNNPNDPPAVVTFGEQTTNEMCFVFLGATSDQPGRIRVKAQEAKKE